MADERIVTNIVANSDFSNLIADVQRVTSSLFKLQQELAGTNRALSGQIDAANAMFNQTMLKTGQFSSHFVSLTSDVEKFGRNLDSGRLKLKDYFRVYQEHSRTTGGLIRDLAKEQVKLQNAVLQPLGRNAQGLMQYNVHIPRGLDLTKNKTALLKQELQIMNKVIQDGGVQLINWGKNTQWAGRQLTVGLTLPLAAFGKAAADAFKQADQELTRLTKVYGDVAGTSQQELGRVRKEVAATAKELSAAMGVSFTETIGLAADIAATGKTGNELLSSVSETTRLAVLGEVDRQEAMKATLAIQSAFKQNTEELAGSINFLNAVENQTSTTLNDLVEAIPKAGPVIKGLGGSVQDLALYLTAMREGGINASEGANALKSALASLINPTDVAVAKFKGLGIDLLGIVNKNAGDVTQTLFALQAALDRLDPLQKQQAIEQLFGKFQFSRLNALFENLGRQGSQTLEVLDLMKASAGELESVAARELTAVTESASGRYRRAVESLKAELAGVGDQFLDIGTKIVNFLSKIIDFAQKLPDPIKKVLAFGGAFTAIIGPVIMLTGVLANFFGYIIKGVGHFKALFKGAEGFKLLTPEIIAARAASSQLGDEFYSDALAADTLRLAIKKLSEDLVLLQKNATNATIASSGLGQVLTTTAGTPVMPVGAGRVVDPNNPLLGPRSRAAAHLNPRDPNNPATVFGMTLAPIPVNRTIGANPQVLMEERLPDIEGLTTIRGVSTGVVAPEHARYQALMATLGLQSKKEIQDLKKTIAMGGQVSSEFMATFDDILPITQKLTQNAATQSAAIVAQLHAGKMSAQQARDAIIAVNAQLERELGVQVTAYGAARGRTIDLTKAPLIDQPVVDASGKPNVRGMYRKGIFAKVMDVLGRATRTRTLGGPYSIETTRPIQRNMGGGVFFNNGDQVPGPNVNADVVPAMLTPGEFVIRRDVAQSDPDGMRLLNAGQGEVVPIQGANIGGMIRGIQYRNVGGALSALFRIRSALIGGARKAGSRSTRALFGANPLRMAYEQMRSPRGTRGRFWTQSPLLMEGAPGTGQVVGHLYTNEYRKTMARLGASPSATGSSPQLTIDQLRAQGININSAGNIFDILPNNVMTFGRSFNTKLGKGSATARDWIESNPKPEHLTGLTHFLLELGFGEDDIRQVRRDVLLDINSKVSRMPGRMTEYQFGNLVTGSIRGRLRGLTSPRSMAIAANRGGRIAAYNRGGSVNGRYGYARGIQRNAGGIIPSYKTGGNIRSGQIGGYTSTDLRYLLSMLGIGKTFSPAQEKSPLINVKPVSFPGGRVFAPQPTPQLFQSASALSLGNNPASRAVDSMQIGLARATESIKTTLRTLTTSLSSFRTGLTQTSNVALTASKNLTPTIRPVQNQQVVHGAPLSAWQGAATRQPATAGGMISPAVGRGGMFRGLVAGQLGWMAGSAIGGRFGGQTGSMIGGLVGSMAAPSLVGGFGGGTPEEKLGKTIGPVKNANWAKSAAAAASQGSRWGKVLTTVVGGLTKTNLVLGAATLAVYAGVKAYQNYQRTQELSAAQFGMTAQQAEKAGLKYTDFNKKVKDAVEAQKLLLKQNILTYQNMTNAKAPFEMTITEYKKLRKEVKETMSTQIDMLNVTKSKDLPRVATQLKQQFIAMGMSAEEANKKIFALFQLSNKASFTTSAMGAKSFTDIINPQTAAVSSVESFNFAKQFENTKDQAFALNTALMAIDAGISSIYDKAEKAAQKKKEDFDSTEAMYQAEAEMLDEINSKVNNQNEIGYSVLENLEKQNPFIRQMIKEQDTVVSMWQKMRIAARGYTGDLSALNVQQTQALYDTQIAVAKAVEETNRVGQLKEQYDSIEKLKNQQKSLESAAKGQSVREQINSRDAIKNIDKKIKKINEEAEARKKALREEAQAEDVNLQVQQARLEYEQKVSAGDLTGAAEARLALQRILNEQQTTIAEQQIEDKRVRDVRPFEKQKERLQNDQQKLSDTAALAAESLDSVNKKLAAQQEKVDAVNEAMTNYIVTMGDTNSTEQQKNAAAAAFIDALKNAGEAVDEYTTGEATVGKHGQVIPGKKRKLTVQERAATKVDTGKINQILAESGMNISSTGPIYINGTALGGTPSSPSGIDLWRMGYQGGANSTGIAAPKTTGKKGGPSTTQTTTNAKGEKVLLKEGIFEMNMSQFVGGDKLKPGDVVTIGKGKNDAIVAVSVANGKVKTTGAIEIVSVDSFTRKVQFKEKYKDGGLLSGPGTGTSDSILGMYANGGMVKVSNGEYIINAQTVKDLGVPFFDAINGMKNGGLMTSYNIPKYNDGGRFIEAAAPQSSGLFNINNNFTINAPDGMDVEGLANEVALRVQAATARSMSKIGIDRNISTRYNG